MRIRDWLVAARGRVDGLDAELMLLSALGAEDRSYLTAHGEDEVPAGVLCAAGAMLDRRAAGEPLAYILGYREFYGRKFAVDKRVLIPRPESEALVRLALGLESAPRRVLDVGTGSGCLALTIAAEIFGVKVTAVDKSVEALECAAHNAQVLLGDGWDSRVRFLQSDLLEGVEDLAEYDLIVANLPYVDEQWEFLDRRTLDYEPAGALFAGDGGLALIKKLIDEIKDRGAHPRLILEADPLQHAEIERYVGQNAMKREGFALLFEM